MTQAAFLACPQGPVSHPSLGFFEAYPDATWVAGCEVVLAVNPDYATAPVLQKAPTFAEQLLLVRNNRGWRIVFSAGSAILEEHGRPRGKEPGPRMSAPAAQPSPSLLIGGTRAPFFRTTRLPSVDELFVGMFSVTRDIDLPIA
jgi:hypothetical protein